MTRTQSHEIRKGQWPLLLLVLGLSVASSGCLYTTTKLRGHLSWGRLSKSAILRNARQSQAHANNALFGIVKTSSHPLRCDQDLMRQLLNLGADPFFKGNYYDRTHEIMMTKCPASSWAPFLSRVPSLRRRAGPTLYELVGTARAGEDKRQQAITNVLSMLRNGVNPNYRDRASGCPVLVMALGPCNAAPIIKYSACSNVSYRVIKALIRQGAKVNAKCRRHKGFSAALHMAVKAMRPDLVQLLLSAGANPNVRNRGGKTALNVAAVALWYVAPRHKAVLRPVKKRIVAMLLRRGAKATSGEVMYRYRKRWKGANRIKAAYKKFCVRKACGRYTMKCWHPICRDYGNFRRHIIRNRGWLLLDHHLKWIHSHCVKGKGRCDMRIYHAANERWKKRGRDHVRARIRYDRTFGRTSSRKSTRSGGRKVKRNPRKGGTGPRNRSSVKSSIKIRAVFAPVIRSNLWIYGETRICNQLWKAMKSKVNRYFAYNSCSCLFRKTFAAAHKLRRSRVARHRTGGKVATSLYFGYRPRNRAQGNKTMYYVCWRTAVF